MNAVARWLWRNLGTLLLSLVLSLAVWMAAVNAEDPIETREYPTSVPIVYQGLAEGLMITGTAPQEGTVTLRAPRSVWDQLSGEEMYLVVDLSQADQGTDTLKVTPVVNRQLVRVTYFEPQTVRLTLENAVSMTLTVQVLVSGEPATGFETQQAVVIPDVVQVTGPASSMSRLDRVVARITISGRRDALDAEIEPQFLDADGNNLPQVSSEPAKVRVAVPISQLGGYRSVAVIPLIQGQVERGYHVTNVTVTPTLVTLKSDDPQAVGLLPGFVDTEAISLTGAREDISRRVTISLPEGFSVVGEPTVLVQITISPIESSLTISRALEIQGLAAGLTAVPSPTSASVILAGPLPTLEQLQPDDVRVVLDLTGLGPGIHQVIPLVVVLPLDLHVQTVLPEVIEVTISGTPAPPGTATPSS